MLKKIQLKDKEIPVPVPIATLADAIDWIEATLVPTGSLLTSVILDGDETMMKGFDRDGHEVKLSSHSDLFARIESPKDLSIGTLDAVRDLSFELSKKIKKVAVKTWNLESDTHLTELTEIHDDIKLILNLIDHANGIMDYTHEDLAPINGIAKLLARTMEEYRKAKNRCDWKRVSVLLVNRIEELLKDLVGECETLQLNIFSSEMSELPQQLGIG